jgi:PadR family transcriptional regulator PadR
MKRVDEEISVFVKRYLKTPSPEQLKTACERNLEELFDKINAIDALEAKAARNPSLNRLEYFVLTATNLLEGEGYGVTIWKKVVELCGQEPNMGGLYVALARMEDRELVKSRYGFPLPERGGHPTRFYKITSKGASTLAHTRQNQEFAPDVLGEWV